MLKGALILIKILKDKHRKREQSELLDGDTVGLEQRLEVGERLLSDSEDRDPAPGLHDVVLDLLGRVGCEVVLVRPPEDPVTV